MIEGGVLPHDQTSDVNGESPLWSEVSDKLDAAIKRGFGQSLNADDVHRAKSTSGGWEGDHHFIIMIIIVTTPPSSS